MRTPLLLMILAVLAPAFAQAPDTGKTKCRVEGRVVHSATGAPLKKAIVWLKPFEARDGVKDTLSVSSRSTATDVEGRFSFDAVDPGAYVLSGWRTGYLEQFYGAHSPILGGRPFRLDSGQNLTDMVLKLTAQGMLYGKVTDEDGDPVPNAQVQALRLSSVPGRRQTQNVTAVTSQDDGSFVIGNLVPGHYFLSAAYSEQVEVESGKPHREAYVTTYFPETIDPERAGEIDLAAGAEIHGLAIRLHQARVFQIRGKAVNQETGEPAPNTQLELVRMGDERLPLASRTVGIMAGDDGVFQIRSVLPGDYVIQAATDAGMIKLEAQQKAIMWMPSAAVGRLPVHVGGEDVDHLVMPLGDGAVLQGTIRMEGAREAARIPGKLWIRLLPDGDAPSSPVSRMIGDDGTFNVFPILPDAYVVDVSGLPDGVYLKFVRFEGQDVGRGRLDLTAGKGGTLDLVLSSKAATISGTVRGANGEIARGAPVRLWSPTGMVESVTADENGNFRVGRLGPGEYYVLAWDEVDPELDDATLLKRLEKQATSVNVEEGGRQTIDLKTTSRDVATVLLASLK
jgi:hypothetical protein